jgi:diaminohydroxyphosphoribosylaminopyrimidine deaminase / 5-amino-6-(5-phosphoribosylamino)uracil reductase
MTDPAGDPAPAPVPAQAPAPVPAQAATPAERAAMRRALALAAAPGVPHGPNPRVGCVLLDPDGRTIAEGLHRGAGTPHAEVDALGRAGPAARGATAVVTLEPCAHTGRTGPCADALLAAGVARVVYAQADPNPVAAGGAARLAAGGVAVVGGVLADDALALNEAWTFAVTQGRPLVTWKVAATLDGRVAAADGSSRWITGAAAREDVHHLRGTVDAVLVGTGTALADDPSLTVRAADGSPAERQPLRAVMGMRPIPDGARLRDGAASLRVLATHDPAAALQALAGDEVCHVLLEGGPTLAAAFLRAGLVDRVVWYLAPALLGGGAGAVGDLGITSIEGIRQLRITAVDRIGQDVRIRARMGPEPHG